MSARNDGERGAVDGLSPVRRVDRIHGMLHGLRALVILMDQAREAEDKVEAPCTHSVWQAAHHFIADRLVDLQHEVSALHADARRAP